MNGMSVTNRQIIPLPRNGWLLHSSKNHYLWHTQVWVCVNSRQRMKVLNKMAGEQQKITYFANQLLVLNQDLWRLATCQSSWLIWLIYQHFANRCWWFPVAAKLFSNFPINHEFIVLQPVSWGKSWRGKWQKRSTNSRNCVLLTGKEMSENFNRLMITRKLISSNFLGFWEAVMVNGQMFTSHK